MEINILLTRKFFDADISYIKSRISKDCKLIIPENYNIETLVKLSKNAHIFLGNLINDKLIKNSPKLKFVQIPWTGVDNIDFVTIKKHEITVCNSHSNSYAVAEYAIALYFAAAKKIVYHDKELRLGRWNRPKTDDPNIITPFSQRISNSKIAIVGYGAIGKKIKKFLSGFETDFYIVDTVMPEIKEEKCSYFKPKELYKVISRVNAVFVCVPLVNETKEMVNLDFFNAMKSSAIFINISRGEVVNEKDLFNVLKNNKIAAAGIDTWYNYPNANMHEVQPSKLYDFSLLQNLVMSSHRAAFVEGELPHLNDAITNINRASEGKKPFNIISLKNMF